MILSFENFFLQIFLILDLPHQVMNLKKSILLYHTNLNITVRAVSNIISIHPIIWIMVYRANIVPANQL